MWLVCEKFAGMLRRRRYGAKTFEGVQLSCWVRETSAGGWCWDGMRMSREPEGGGGDSERRLLVRARTTGWGGCGGHGMGAGRWWGWVCGGERRSAQLEWRGLG